MFLSGEDNISNHGDIKLTLRNDNSSFSENSSRVQEFLNDLIAASGIMLHVLQEQQLQRHWSYLTLHLVRSSQREPAGGKRGKVESAESIQDWNNISV